MFHVNSVSNKLNSIRWYITKADHSYRAYVRWHKDCTSSHLCHAMVMSFWNLTYKLTAYSVQIIRVLPGRGLFLIPGGLCSAGLSFTDSKVHGLFCIQSHCLDLINIRKHKSHLDMGFFSTYYYSTIFFRHFISCRVLAEKCLQAHVPFTVCFTQEDQWRGITSFFHFLSN